jgi:hypothetical protein
MEGSVSASAGGRLGERVVPILATPFGRLTLPVAESLNAALRTRFAEHAAAHPGAPGSNPLCYLSADDLFEWPDPAVRELAEALLRGVYDLVAEISALEEAQLRALALQARGGFTIVRPDGCVPARSHALAAWSAVYCVAAPEPSPSRRDSGMLRLYESRLGTMFQDASNATMRLPYAAGHYAWRPVPGQMALFPASLTHEVALVRAVGELVLVTARVRFVAPGQTGLSRW